MSRLADIASLPDDARVYQQVRSPRLLAHKAALEGDGQLALPFAPRPAPHGEARR